MISAIFSLCGRAATSAPTWLATILYSSIAVAASPSWSWDLTGQLGAHGVIGPPFQIGSDIVILLKSEGTPGSFSGRSLYEWLPLRNVMHPLTVEQYKAFTHSHERENAYANVTEQRSPLGNGRSIQFVVPEASRCTRNFLNHYSVWSGSKPNPIWSFVALAYVDPPERVDDSRIDCERPASRPYLERFKSSVISIVALQDGGALVWSVVGPPYVLRLDSQMRPHPDQNGKLVLVSTSTLDAVFQAIGPDRSNDLARYNALSHFLEVTQKRED